MFVPALLLGPLWQHKGRLAVSLLAIALGVALGYAIQIINQSAIDEFAQAVQTLSGDADLTVRGPRSGFDEQVFARIAALREVAVASPIVEVEARVAREEQPLAILGIDVFRAGRIQPALVAEAQDFLDLLRADTIFLSPAAGEWLGAKPGETIEVQAGMRILPLRVAGTLRAEGVRNRMGVMDIAGAQRLFDCLGRVTRIDLRLRPGADPQAVQRRVQALLPAGVHIERPEASLRATARLTRAYRVNLNVLALVALFTGGLLIFSTQALAVVRRRSQLALLRALGVTRTGLVRMLLVEGATIGVVGGGFGVLLGHLAADALLARIGPDLGAGYFRGLAPTPRFDLLAALLFFALGVAAAALGSLLPAIEAARSPPAQALKAGDDQRVFERLAPWWPGLALFAAGACAALLPAVDGLPIFGYVAIALMLIGTIVLMPRAMRVFLRALPPPRQPMLRLAHAQLANAPGPATTSLAAIVAAVSLTVSMGIMVASFRTSLDAWLDRVLPADLYVRAGGIGDTAFFAPDDLRQISSTPGVARATFLRTHQIALDPARPRVTMIARDIDPAEPQATLPLVATSSASAGADAPPPVWVSELMVDVYGFAPGRVIELPLGGRNHRFTVAGVWRDYARQNGSVVVERGIYERLTGDRAVTDAALWLEVDASAREVSERLRAGWPLGDRVEIAEPGEIRRLSLGVFDRSFAATYALEAAAILIGLFGLSSSLASQVLARRHELGMLRHIGVTRRQLGAMLAAEGSLTSAVGLAVGCGLGWLIGVVLIQVVNRQSFHWSMELHMPWLGLGGFAAVMLSLATLTAWVSARQAMGLDVIRAVREDW